MTTSQDEAIAYLTTIAREHFKPGDKLRMALVDGEHPDVKKCFGNRNPYFLDVSEIFWTLYTVPDTGYGTLHYLSKSVGVTLREGWKWHIKTCAFE